VATDRGISFKLAIQGAEESIRVLSTFGDKGQAEIEKIVGKLDAAGKKIKEFNEEATSNKSANQRSYLIGNLSNQIQDFIVQYEGGTSALRAFGQQAPQAASAFALLGGSAAAVAPVIGTVIVGVTALGGVLYALSGSHQSATEAAKSHADEMGKLFTALGVSTKSVDDLAASFSALGEQQQGLVAAHLAAQVDLDTKALNEAKVAADGYVASLAKPGLLQEAGSVIGRLFGGGGGDSKPSPGLPSTLATAGTPESLPTGGADQEAAARQMQAQSSALEGLYKNLQLGAIGYTDFVDAVQKYLGTLGDSEEQQRAAARGFLDLADKQEVAKQAADLHKAQYDKLLESLGKTGAFTDADRAILAHAEAMSRATAAATALGKAEEIEQKARNTAGLPTNPRDLYVQKAVNDADPFGTQPVAERTRFAIAKGAEYDANKAAEDQKKLNQANEEAVAVVARLSESTDKYAKAGNDAAAARAKQLGTELAATPAGQAAIERDREAAVAAAKHTDALQKNEQAKRANEQLTQRIAGAELTLKAGTDKATQAAAEAEAQARQSGATDQAKIRRIGELAAAKVRQAEATVAANMADEDQAKADAYVQDSHDKLVASQQALAVAQQGGVDQTREAIAARQAEQAVIQTGIVFGDEERAQLVAENAQRILNTQAAQDYLAAQKRINDEREKTDQLNKGPDAVDRTGHALSATQLSGLDPQETQEAVRRAQAVADAEAQIPAYLRETAEGERQVNEAVRQRLDHLDAEATKRQRVNNLILAAKQSQEADDNRVLGIAARDGTIDQYNKVQQGHQIRDDLLNQGLEIGSTDYYQRFWAEQENQAKGAVNKANELLKTQTRDAVVNAFVTPIQQIPNILGKSLDDFFTQLNTTGKVSFGELGTSLLQGIQGIGQNFLGNALQAPFKIAGDQFAQVLNKSITENGGGIGGVFKGLQDFSDKGTLQAGIVGAGIGSTVGGIGGTIGTAITGNQNTGLGGSVGGLAGGVLGGVFGGPGGALIGSAIGTLAGSVFGSLFGGGVNTGENNDAQGYTYNPYQRTYQQTDRQGSPQNAQASRALAEQAANSIDILRSLGLAYQGTFQSFKIGNVSGVDYNQRSFGSQQDALQAAIRYEISNSVGDISGTLRTVLQNTKASSPQQLQQDISFSREYESLTGQVGTFGQQLTQIRDKFGAATNQAERLGLGTDALSQAQGKAEASLREQYTLQTDQLLGRAGPYRAAMQDLSDKFKVANDNARDLGYTTGELNRAQQEQGDFLRTQFTNQYRQLTGQTSDYSTKLAQLNDNFRQAALLGRDLGITTSDLTRAQQQQTQLLRTQSINQYNELTGQTTDYSKQLIQLNENFRQAAILGRDLGIDTSNLGQLQQKSVTDLRNTFVQRFNELTTVSTGFGSSLQQLRDRFKEARDIAGQLGLSTADLAAKQAAAEQQLAKEQEATLRTQVQGAADQLRQFLTGLTTPLRNALSAFGGLAGIVSPQQQLTQGLAEYRATLARARRDDVSAIQALPQQAQAVLQLAKQYDASGAGFAAIFKEVNSGLQEVLTANQQRSDSILASIPDTLKLTAADQIRTLQDGFTKVSDQLEALRAEIRLLQPGRAA
jgi:hypothetical protein